MSHSHRTRKGRCSRHFYGNPEYVCTCRPEVKLQLLLITLESFANECERMGRDAIDEANRELLPAFAASLRKQITDTFGDAT